MPCEYASFFLKPANFFDMNPGINLPASTDAASVELGGCCKSGKANGVEKSACCGLAGAEGCTCTPGCQCVCDKARAEAPASRL